MHNDMSNNTSPPRNVNDTFAPQQHRNMPRPGVTGKAKERDKYFGEEVVHYGIVIFMLFTGWWLAWVTGEDNWSKLGQVFGFSVTTFLIITVYRGLKHGKYRGSQRKFAKSLYTLLLIDEGITIFAKYHEPFREFYLMWIAVSLPILAYSAFKLIVMDEEVELVTVKKENRIRLKYVTEVKEVKKKSLALERELATISAAENTHSIYTRKLLKASTGWSARQKCKKAIASGMNQVYDLVGVITRKNKEGKETVKLEDLQLVPHSGDSGGPIKK